MRTLRPAGRFRKDYKRETKGKSAAYVKKLDGDLAAVVRVLVVDGALEERYKDHPLTGDWKDHRDCHYRKPGDNTLELVRLGSHSELGLK
jgi:mRNA interferase YafQ